jgi:hypothetical protein
MPNRPINKANLKLALQKNNEKIKEYVNNHIGQGSQNIVAYLHPNMFSLEERVVGCWVNGKPLYEKTFATKTPKVSSQTALNFCDLDIENIVDFISTFENQQIINPAPNGNNDNYLTFWYNKTAKLLHIACTEETWVGHELYITIQYTKTTDEKNSFTNDMIKDYVPTLTEYTNEEVLDAVNSLW